MAAARPSVDPATAASSGGATADATAWRGVMPTACRTWRSATVAEVYLATDWPTRNSAATRAASAKASRQAASYRLIRSIVPPKKSRSSHTSISARPVTRARPARNAGMAARPPFSRISALMYTWPLVPMMLALYLAYKAGDGLHAAERVRAVTGRGPEDVASHPDDAGLDGGTVRGGGRRPTARRPAAGWPGCMVTTSPTRLR